MTIKAGAKVRALRTYKSLYNGVNQFTKGRLYTVDAARAADSGGQVVHIVRDDEGHPNGIWNNPLHPLFSLARVPSIADDLRLYPQDRTILAHLKRGKTISPMKALVVYGISRLAACIHNIRKAGYMVENVITQDEQGHKYSNYTLVG